MARRIAGGDDDVVEPIYGKTYLPRKFKTVVAVPPSNDVDVFAHDLGFIAVLDAAGDGDGLERHGRRRHGHDPRRARHLSANRRHARASARPRDAVAVAEAVVTVQRDWGDRSNRKHARLKYTIEDRGLAAFRAEVERRPASRCNWRARCNSLRPATATAGPRTASGRAHLTLFIENGRVQDLPSKTDADRAAPHRRNPHRRLSHYREPEPHHRRRDEGAARGHRSDSPSSTGWSARSQGCGATRWPVLRSPPAVSRSPRASAICRR